MTLNIQSVSNCIIPLFGQIGSTISKSHHHKIIAVVVAVFASIAALYYVARSCLFNAQSSPTVYKTPVFIKRSEIEQEIQENPHSRKKMSDKHENNEKKSEAANPIIN